ncbi:hypothetical protein BaRGS_00036259, partial [Batillaria attramentaria]
RDTRSGVNSGVPHALVPSQQTYCRHHHDLGLRKTLDCMTPNKSPRHRMTRITIRRHIEATLVRYAVCKVPPHYVSLVTDDIM